MKLSWKKVLTLGMTVALSVMTVFPALAGEWKHLDGGEYWQWWYVNDDGTYPANAWQEIDGKWYHFDENGYLDVGWRYMNDKWYFMDSNGVMAENVEMFGGRFGEDGAWISNRIPPDNYHVSTEEDDAYWAQKWTQYGLLNVDFTNNGDGTYTFTYGCTENTVFPDLIDTMLAKASYAFNGFEYNWQIADLNLTFTVYNPGFY